MDAVNSVLGLTRGSLFSFMMQHWKQSTKKKKSIFSQIENLPKYQASKKVQIHLYRTQHFCKSASCPGLTISSTKGKKGNLHGLQLKKKNKNKQQNTLCFLLVNYHMAKQMFYLHKLLNALLEIFSSTHSH